MPLGLGEKMNSRAATCLKTECESLRPAPAFFQAAGPSTLAFLMLPFARTRGGKIWRKDFS